MPVVARGRAEKRSAIRRRSAAIAYRTDTNRHVLFDAPAERAALFRPAVSPSRRSAQWQQDDEALACEAGIA